MFEDFISFFFAGSVAALVDLAVYNVYLKFVGDDRRIMASVVSVTVAMVVSFYLYRNWVFVESNGAAWPVAEFLLVTLVAIYGIQSAVIHISSRSRRARIWSERIGCWCNYAVWQALRLGPGAVVGGSGGGKGQVADIVERNAVKMAAMAIALMWNFFWYRLYVFV